MQASTSRALAFAATVLGFAGLALGLLGGAPGLMGLVLAALALLVLLAIAWLALEGPRALPPAEAWPEPPPATDLDFEAAAPPVALEPEAEWTPEPLPPAPPAAEPAIDLDSPLQRALAGLPPKPPTPGRYSPRMPVIPEEVPEDEPVQRARRLVPSGQTLGEKRDAAKKAKARPAPEEMEFTVVPTKPRARARPAVVPTEAAPIVVAQVAGKGAVPADLARGKCGGCGSLLWAPKARPINLRCPQCDKITLLR